MSWEIRQGDALEQLPEMPERSAHLILTDPPYYRFKDVAWDRQWRSQEEYIAWIGQLCQEWRRVLTDNGSLYVFASDRMAARVEVEIGKGFHVLNRIVWVKHDGTKNKGGAWNRGTAPGIRGTAPGIRGTAPALQPVGCRAGYGLLDLFSHGAASARQTPLRKAGGPIAPHHPHQQPARADRAGLLFRQRLNRGGCQDRGPRLCRDRGRRAVGDTGKAPLGAHGPAAGSIPGLSIRQDSQTGQHSLPKELAMKDSGPPTVAPASPRRTPRSISPCPYCTSPMHYSRSRRTLQCASASCGYTARIVPRLTIYTEEA